MTVLYSNCYLQSVRYILHCVSVDVAVFKCERESNGAVVLTELLHVEKKVRCATQNTIVTR